MAPNSSSNSLSPLLGLIAGVAVGSVGTFLLTSRRAIQGLKSQCPPDASAEPSFAINPALVQGNVAIGQLPLCQVLLYDDARFPGWLILVPRRDALKEVIDLTEAGQEALWKEVATALQIVQRLYKPHKLNVSAIGNHCPQLHIHVSARNPGDAAWPDVHLGAKGREYFASDELQQHRRDLIKAFQQEVPAFIAEAEDEEEV